MHSGVPWLPTSCFTSCGGAAPFVHIVEAWSQEWFHADGWSVLGTWSLVDAAGDKEWSVLRDSPKVQLYGKSKSVQSMALGILSLPDQTNPSTQDLRLMRALANRAIDDLLARFDEVLGARQSGRKGFAEVYNLESREIYSLSLGRVGKPQIAIHCAAADLVSLVRSTFGRREQREALCGLDAALREQTVSVAAHIGQVSLTLEDVAGLEPGDLLVLDRSADSPVQLLINDSPTDLPFSLSEQDGQICMELKEA